MSDEYWRKPIRWDKHAQKIGIKPLVFPSLCDPFDNEVSIEWLSEFFDLIHSTPNVRWLLLTKRPELAARRWFKADGSNGWPTNAALGTTVEDRKRVANMFALLQAESSINELSATKVPRLFASFEPLLEDLGDIAHFLGPRGSRLISYVITGGETDQGKHRARPTPAGAFRSIRDQCVRMGAEYHHKQNGEYLDTVRVGKTVSGRLLDGVEHNTRIIF
jgi:protein gp37